VSLDPKIAPLAIGTPASERTRRGEPSGSPEGAAGPDAQKLARLASEFESMLLLQMLREMRKSGSWKDEGEEKDGFGAETLFDTLDQELASYLTKSRGFGLEKSLVGQVTGAAPGVSAIVPAQLPALDLPVSPGTSAEATVKDDVAIFDRVETSPFGWRKDPFSGATKYHRGVDLRAAYGEPVGAADWGTVVFAGEQRGYGQTVVLEHAGGVRTRYAHLSSLMTEVGAEVKAGEPIGRAGRSGRATGTHLHFEVTQNGRPVDPHSFGAGGLKVERVTADWGVANGPTLPGVASDQRGSALQQSSRLRLADDSISGPRSAGTGSGAD
jgi:murein DD-endopeptidase MepM/ murein hydrolase activator NlpD